MISKVKYMIIRVEHMISKGKRMMIRVEFMISKVNRMMTRVESMMNKVKAFPEYLNSLHQKRIMLFFKPNGGGGPVAGINLAIIRQDK